MLTSFLAPRAWLGAAPMALAAALFGCETPCPSEPTSCPNSASLSVKIPDSESDPAAYEIEIVRDDVAPARCLVILPVPADWAGPWTAHCDGQGAGYVIASVARTAVANCSHSLNGSQCWVDHTGQMLSLSMSGEPSSVELRIKRGAERFAPYQTAVGYDEVHPDGPSCGSGCKQAAIEPSWAELTAPESDD